MMPLGIGLDYSKIMNLSTYGDLPNFCNVLTSAWVGDVTPLHLAKGENFHIRFTI
jgi:hypothetical protein